MESKTCSRCGAEKDLTEFYIRRRSPDGLTPHCKACNRVKRKRQYAGDRERAIRTATEWTKRDREENPEKWRRYARAGNWRRRGMTEEQIVCAHQLTDQPCFYCGCARAGGIDHFVAQANGGSHDPENLVACCKSCNREKNVKPVLEFLAARFAAATIG